MLAAGAELHLVAAAVVERAAAIAAIGDRREVRDERGTAQHAGQSRVSQQTALPGGAEEDVRRTGAGLDRHLGLFRVIAEALLVARAGGELRSGGQPERAAGRSIGAKDAIARLQRGVPERAEAPLLERCTDLRDVLA